MENKLLISCSPHIHSASSSRRIMADVLIALVPATVAGTVLFGLRALIVVLFCAACCMLCEYIWQKLMKKTVTVGDLSAAVTGVLFGLNLPVNTPLWQAAFGCVVAIIVVKQLFGGIGRNFANPAITARIVMLMAFSSMTAWVSPDGVSSATPLSILKTGTAEDLPSLLDMFLGNHGGCIGETCVAALLLGGIYLVIRRVINWYVPVTFIGTVALMSLLLGGNPLYQITAGGLIIGAVFMATDYTTTPRSMWGKIIFALGCGILTVVIRTWGQYPEGVSFAILIMNILTPFISRFTRRKPLGGDVR